jgi:hypothetical protein
MTDTPLEPLVPEGKRASDLTVKEIDYASRGLGCNVLRALATQADGEPHQRREMALAWVATVWGKKLDPAATIKDYETRTVTELVQLLGMNRTPVEEAAPNVDPDDPSPSPSD